MIRILIAALCLAAPTFGQRAAAVFLYTPNARPVAGTPVEVEVMAIDANSNLLGNVNAVWTTNNADVAEFRNGQVVTKSPGMVDLSATVLGARGVLRLQVLPARIDVVPANAKAERGDVVEYKALVYNASGELIPNVAIRWDAVGLDGQINNGLSISRTGGSLSAGATGYYRVRANLDYGATGQGQFQPVFASSTGLTVSPKKYYRTSVLFSSQTRASGLRLTPRNSRLTINDSGDLAFLASVEGLGNAVVRVAGKSLELAALSGESMVRPGTVVGDFDDALINNTGEILTAATHYGTEVFSNGRSVYFVTRPGVSRGGTLAGLIGSGADAIVNFRLGRRSYNNQGRYAYVADFSLPGTRTGRTGIFMSDGTFDELILKSTDSLPGLKGPLTFPAEFSIDDQDNVWFVVVDADGRPALCYRSVSSGAVQVMVSPSEGLGGYKPAQFDYVVCSPSGALAFRMRDATLGWAMVVMTRAPITGAKVTPMTTDHRAIFALNAKGDMLAYGNFGSATGLYLIPFTGTPKALALLGRAAPNGEIYTDFRSAGLNANGDIAFAARTDASQMIVVREGGGKDELVFPQPDFRIPDAMRFTFPTFLVNNRSGAVKVISGSSQNGVVELTARGPRVMLAPDLALPSGQVYGDNNNARGQPDGSMLSVADAGVFRFTPTTIEIAAPGRTAMAGGTQYQANSMAANSSGAVLTMHGSSFGPLRLNLTANGQTRFLGYFGNTSNTAYRTAAPGGAYFVSSGAIELDDTGTPYVFATTNIGRTGIYAFRGSAWTEVAVANQTVVERTTLVNVNNWDVGGDRVFVLANMGPGRQAVLQCTAEGCRTMIDLSGEMPRGVPAGSFGQISANRNNDVALTYGAGNNEDVAVIPFGGEMRLVLGKDTPLVGGEWILSFRSLQMQNDGRVLINAFTTNDNITILEAEPLN